MSFRKKTIRREVTPESLWAEVAQQNASSASPVLRLLFSDGFGVAMSAVENAIGAPLKSDGTQIVTTDTLTKDLLSDLFEHRICALHVPGFCSKDVADKLSAWILEKSRMGNWKVNVVRDGAAQDADSDVSYGIGVPFGVAVKSREEFIRYFKDAETVNREIRTAVDGLAPIDRLRLELDEAWPMGARVAKFKGLRRRLGTARVMTPSSLMEGIAKTEGMLHVDNLPLLKKGTGRFSANIYLEVPPDGGELAVYNVNPGAMEIVRNFSLMKHLMNFDPNAQDLIRSKLPPPLTLKPGVGDLILVDTSRPHSVRGFTEGRRITTQCWLDYRADMPLMLYS